MPRAVQGCASGGGPEGKPRAGPPAGTAPGPCHRRFAAAAGGAEQGRGARATGWGAADTSARVPAMGIWDRIQAALEPIADVPDEVEHQLRLATGALLLEMCRADFKVHFRERQSIAAAIRRAFALSREETEQLLDDAEAEQQCAVSIQIYTSLIKEYSTRLQKHRLIEDLWRVAYADGELHDLEERLVVRVAALIELPPRTAEKLRHEVAGQCAREAGKEPPRHPAPGTSV